MKIIPFEAAAILTATFEAVGAFAVPVACLHFAFVFVAAGEEADRGAVPFALFYVAEADIEIPPYPNNPATPLPLPIPLPLIQTHMPLRIRLLRPLLKAHLRGIVIIRRRSETHRTMF